MTIKLSPSLLSADFAELAKAAKMMEQAEADYLHVDVMDGHFVPNLTVGPVVVKALKQHTSLPLDVHLMITDPLKYAPAFAKAGAASLTFHMEAVENPSQVIADLRQLGVNVAASIKPQTPISAILPYLKDLDMVLVMTVEPGFGGQSFMPDMLPKIRDIAAAIQMQQLACEIEVDGGIDEKTAPLTIEAGATVLVAGNAIFNTPDPIAAARRLKRINNG